MYPQTTFRCVYKVEEWLNDTNFWVNKIHPEDREWVVNYCKENVKKRISFNFEYRMIAKNGTIVWFRDIVNVDKEEDGELITLKGIMIDITKSKKTEVANDIRNIFNAPDLKEAERLLCNTIDKYKDSESKLADWMENNIPETFTVFKLPSKHQKKLRTSNMAERVNKEIRRRTKVVGIFPNSQSCLRLITAILLEISDDWITGAAYLDMSA